METEPTAAGTGATPAAGATPAQPATNGAPAGATPAASTAASPAVQPPSTATGDEGLGETGRRAIDAERTARREAEDRAKSAETELTQLREASQTDQEKARTQAVREAVSAERATWQSRFREAEVRGALRGAGIVNENFLSLAVAAPEFRELKVGEEGPLEGLSEAIETFKKNYPEAFGKKAEPGPGGSWGGSEGGSSKREPETLQDAVMDRLAKQR